MSFTIFYNENTPFQAIKTRGSKSRKTGIVPKGLTHGFGPKMAIFSTSFFQVIQARKKCFTTFQNEKMPFQAIKTRSSKRGKIAIFPKGLTHGFGRKNEHFFNLFFFQAIQDRKMCFTIFQNEGRPFQAIKTRSLKSRKIGIFLKGLTHRFWTKMAFFATSFFQAKQGNKISFTTFQNGKTPFWALKKEVKKSKNCHFSKRGNPLFWSKNSHFSN